MGKLADFFTMTRRERIGTLVVTLLLAVAVGAVIGVKSCVRNSSLPPEANTQIQEFKQQVEAVDSASTHHRHHKKTGKKTSNKQKGKEHKSKSKQPNRHNNNSPRRFDDVPTF